MSILRLIGAALAFSLAAPLALAAGDPGVDDPGVYEPRGGAPLPLADDAPVSPPAASPVEVIFTGFARRMDKGASVFVRMTGEVPVVVEQSGRRVIYHLTGAKLGVKNNANPLPTGEFGPPVSSVALVAAVGSVDVVIDLTNDPGPGDKAPPFRVVSQAKLATLVVDLPPPAQ